MDDGPVRGGWARSSLSVRKIESWTRTVCQVLCFPGRPTLKRTHHYDDATESPSHTHLAELLPDCLSACVQLGPFDNSQNWEV